MSLHHRTRPAARPAAAALATAAAAAFSLSSLTATATAFTWINPAGGSWTDAANWSPAIAPSVLDDTFFNLGAAAPDFPSYPGYTVALPMVDTFRIFVPNVTLQTDKVTFTQPASNKPNLGFLAIANAATQSASLTLAGGTVSTTSASLATSGTGSLAVSPNTISTTGILPLTASGFGGTATLTATGPNSVIQTGSLDLARGSGTATLNLTAGAVAISDPNFATAYPTFPINYPSVSGTANLAAGSGSAHVTATGTGTTFAFNSWKVADGLGSTATIAFSDGTQAYARNLTLGSDGGTASLSLDGPGTVLTCSGSLSVGYGLTPAGSATVRGTGTFALSNGASLAAPDAQLDVGALSGAGSLSITSGSSVTCGRTEVGPFSTATVGSDTTSPSTWTVTSDLVIAKGSVTANAGGQLLVRSLSVGISSEIGGTLALHDGSVSATRTSNLYAGTLSGSGTVHAPSLSVTAATIAPDGTLALDANLALSRSTATLAFDIASPTTYDRLTSIRTLTFGGTLAVSLSPSYTPSPGDSFDLLDFTTRNGTTTFSALSLPPLPPGLTWDTSALYTTGTLAVAIPEPTSHLTACTLALPLLSRRRTKS